MLMYASWWHLALFVGFMVLFALAIYDIASPKYKQKRTDCEEKLDLFFDAIISHVGEKDDVKGSDQRWLIIKDFALGERKNIPPIGETLSNEEWTHSWFEIKNRYPELAKNELFKTIRDKFLARAEERHNWFERSGYRTKNVFESRVKGHKKSLHDYHEAREQYERRLKAGTSSSICITGQPDKGGVTPATPVNASSMALTEAEVRDLESIKEKIKHEEEELGAAKELNDSYISSVMLFRLKATLLKVARQVNVSPVKFVAWVAYISRSLAISLVVVVVGFQLLVNLLASSLIGWSDWAEFLVTNIMIFASTIVATTCLAAAIVGAYCWRNFWTVEQESEWVMEAFEEYFETWDSGWHIATPFIVKRRAIIYTGTHSMYLRMDDDTEGDQKSAKVDFSNASAAVYVRLLYRIFDSVRAVYKIDDLNSNISDKMESGIRAYYGGQQVDEAIRGRSDVDLRSIITQSAVEADRFKSWGVEISGIAVTDIELPKEVIEQRAKVLEAEKDLQVAEIKESIAIKDAKITETRGKGEGLRLARIMEHTKLDKDQALYWDLETKRFESMSKAQVLIVGNDGGGAAAGAAAATVMDRLANNALGRNRPDANQSATKDNKNKKQQKPAPATSAGGE